MLKISHSLPLMVLFLVGTFLVKAQNAETLRFNSSGEYKILQLTDIHINLDEGIRVEGIETARKVIDIEKPDLVVLTGDIATDGNPASTYNAFEKLFEEKKLPWVVTFGNHDSSADMKRKEVAAYLARLKNCLNVKEDDTDGENNFAMPVYGKGNEQKALLYFMDSQEYSTLKPLVGGWGWFTHNQVEWYRQKAAEIKKENNGKVLPALAFFHIPLPEYYAAWSNKKIKAIGTRKEKECAPEINTGMFAAMLECGDVMGTFVGHDHYNDYIGVHYGIALAYGRATKYGKGRKHPLPGGRVIVLKEGQRGFTTWIREVTGKKLQESQYPESFLPKNK